MATEFQTEAQVIEALRNRFPQPEWAMFTGVANGTGSHANRWADAVAMNLWPSRGLEIVGFEVKVSRGDMLRELKDPRKADEVAKHCDRWFIAVGSKSIVGPEELPASWGLLLPTGSAKGPTMKIAKDAQRMRKKSTKLQPVPRAFCAAILRRASEQFDVANLRRLVRSEIYDEVKESVHANAESSMRYTIEELQRRLSQSQKRVDELTNALKTVSDHPCTTEQIAQATKLIQAIRGWQGAKAAATTIVRSIDGDKKRLAQISATMQLVVELSDTLGGSDE